MRWSSSAWRSDDSVMEPESMRAISRVRSAAGHLFYTGEHRVFVGLLAGYVMDGSLGRDLCQMRHHDDLVRLGEFVEHFGQGKRRSTADAGVYLVEHQRRDLVARAHRRMQRQHDPGKLRLPKLFGTTGAPACLGRGGTETTPSRGRSRTSLRTLPCRPARRVPHRACLASTWNPTPHRQARARPPRAPREGRPLLCGGRPRPAGGQPAPGPRRRRRPQPPRRPHAPRLPRRTRRSPWGRRP